MKKTLQLFILALVIFFLTGCGETIHGVAKDSGRITQGVKTILFRDK